jgi:pimeloyl-ACP methyl ester carboxylesterase
MTIGHQILGSGPERVILCHGWFGGGQATYGPLLPYLDTDACTYALVDYRGYGSSKDMAGRFTMQEAATDILALADKLGWQQFHLVGHSMGGKVVNRIALAAPDRVKSVHGVTPVPPIRIEFPPNDQALFEGAITDDGKRIGIVSFSTGNRLTPVWARGLIADLSRNSTRDAFGGYLRSWMGDDFSAEVKGSSLALKITVGAFDPTLTRPFMESTFGHLFPKVEYETLENAGHYPAHEVPVALATAIDAFVARHR